MLVPARTRSTLTPWRQDQYSGGREGDRDPEAEDDPEAEAEEEVVRAGTARISMGTETTSSSRPRRVTRT